MNFVNVNIINKSNNPLPDYSTIGSAGVDIRAFLSEPITINPFERFAVPTGLFCEIPYGYEIQIRPRSGLAIKSGITVLNTPGTIDSDYRGEIKVILINLSNSPFIINNGDRIAQMVLSLYSKFNFCEVDSLSDTDRGISGFGHSGVK